MRATRLLLQTYNRINTLGAKQVGQNATVNGWIKSVRRLKRVAFADVSDGSSSDSLMVVMSPDEATNLNTGTCIKVEGLLKESQGQQSIEMQAAKVQVLGAASSDYPLQKKYHTPEFLRTIPQFRWKTTSNAAVLRYRSYALSQIGQYFTQNGFTQVNSPMITSSDCEGAGEVFKVAAPNNPQFFGKPTYLSVSSQLHLEVYAAALSRVWNMAPAFRAEESDTNRHLSEFWMIEPEMAFTETLNDVMQVAEDMIRSAVPKEGNSAGADILKSIRSEEKQAVVKRRWETLRGDGTPWPRATYTEAVKQVQNAPQLKPIQWGEDLATEHEKYLAGEVYKGPVFVTDYPTQIKPFYMKKNADGQTVACFDLLVPDMGELIGGSLREDDYDQLIQAMTAAEMDLQDMQWYTDLRKQGSFPHGGYGMGFERFVCYICGVENIRDAIGFPRHVGSCVC